MPGIDHQSIAETMSDSRRAVDGTLVMLKTQLMHMKERIDQALAKMNEQTTEADLSILGHMHEQGAQIDRLVKQLEQQRLFLEQALTYMKLVHKTK